MSTNDQSPSQDMFTGHKQSFCQILASNHFFYHKTGPRQELGIFLKNDLEHDPE